MGYGAPFVVLTKIDAIEIDVTQEEEHRFETMITQNPVEDGTVKSDHIVLLPFVYTINGRLTDASMVFLGVPKTTTSKEAFQRLVDLQNKKELFSITTGLQVYENMFIETLSAPRNGADGQSVRFSATFREMFVIGNDSENNRDLISSDIRHSAALPIDNGTVQLQAK